jgi:xanthine dehydrogenase accessory factor
VTQVYAIATVVGRAAPVSSHLGDRAIVYADGRMEGFVGGSCSREIIRNHALEALRTGEPRLVRVRPEATEILKTRDAVTVPMGCSSQGAVDVYIEPHLPKRRLLLAGFTPVCDALAQVAPFLDFSVARFVDDDELRDLSGRTSDASTIENLASYVADLDDDACARGAAIVASQGQYDQPALATVLSRDFGFVGLLASRKRAASVMQLLAHGGVPPERIARVRSPAGLPIGARKPAEVAVSILAEIVAVRTGEREREDDRPAGEVAVDPVCGMEVAVAAARYVTHEAGSAYYFCSAHCRAAFTAEPAQFASAPS